MIFCVASNKEFHLVITGTGNLHLQFSKTLSEATVLLLTRFQKLDNLLNVDFETLT